MLYRFTQFELDTQRFELRGAGGAIHVEPMVFDLLRCFVEHVDVVLTRDMIIEQVWNGRSVSDATVASCVKAARKAIGDNGKDQMLIRTIRGRGFQFVGTVTSEPSRADASLSVCVAERTTPAAQPQVCALPAASRIAVLPLFPLSRDPLLGLLGDALSQEVILELSRLRWLFVIARGSAFKFRGQEVDLAHAGQILGVGYVLTGTIMRQHEHIAIAVELCRVADSSVIWAERFVTPKAEVIHMRSALAIEIADALEPRIQQSEALRAAAIPTERLDAWAAYHRGIWHMFRFSRQHNREAGRLFTHAIGADPNFARAHAGLSFTHFQNAFLDFEADKASEIADAARHASRSMELDPLDPFVNLTMGRVEWLRGHLDESLPWIERSVMLRPSYPFAIYNGALIGTLLGEGERNEGQIAKAIELSPIDPLNYAMLATRAMTHLVRGDFETAAKWADRAVRSPNAHHHIFVIAALTAELAGKREQAEAHISLVRQQYPAYSAADFLKAFPFRDPSLRRDVEGTLRRLGL